jgi:hypothetical protein
MPGGQNPVAISLFRWDNSTWNKLENDAVVTDKSFISPAGTVRAKVTQVAFERMPFGQPGLTVRGRGVAP